MGAHLGVAVHVALPERLPSEQEYVPPPVWTYPVLHAGAHAAPLARINVHVPKAPFVGAVTVHGRGLQAAVLVRAFPRLLQDREPVR